MTSDHDSTCPVFQGGDPDTCDSDCTPATRRDRQATGPEMLRMQVKFRQAGITNRTERLARTAEQIGRRVASCSLLTEREVRVVCAWLDSKITETQR